MGVPIFTYGKAGKRSGLGRLLFNRGAHAVPCAAGQPCHLPDPVRRQVEGEKLAQALAGIFEPLGMAFGVPDAVAEHHAPGIVQNPPGDFIGFQALFHKAGFLELLYGAAGGPLKETVRGEKVGIVFLEL